MSVVVGVWEWCVGGGGDIFGWGVDVALLWRGISAPLLIGVRGTSPSYPHGSETSLQGCHIISPHDLLNSQPIPLNSTYIYYRHVENSKNSLDF
jgi:hypothetical protein